MSSRNPYALRAYAKRINYRCSQQEAFGRVSAEDIAGVFAIWGEQCFYCLEPLTIGVNASLDHLVPLSVGGVNTKRNLVPCCTYCNNRKGDRLVVYDRKAHRLVFKYHPRKADW